MNTDTYGKRRTIGHRSEGKETKKQAGKVWNTISKYITFDNDAIFKDPNWPYLWDKKK